MKNILITGAAGFIGKLLCSRLASGNKVIGVDITGPEDGTLNIAWEQADLTNEDSVTAICEKHSPDVVIHCAGIAHQKIGVVDSATYMRVNSEATENLAKAAAKSNPGVCFQYDLPDLRGRRRLRRTKKIPHAKAQRRKEGKNIHRLRRFLRLNEQKQMMMMGLVRMGDVGLQVIML